MAFWDLTKAQRNQLKKAIITRESMVERGINPPKDLHLDAIKKEYSLTTADLKAVLKGME